MSRKSKRRKQNKAPATSSGDPLVVPPENIRSLGNTISIPPVAARSLSIEPKFQGYKAAAISSLLLLLVWLVFGQTLSHGFINFDDDQYVYANPVILKGISPANIAWAFTHAHADNWHPLTTILHMADCQFYGLRPWGHHLTNLLLHAATAVLLFLMLLEMTGALWPCAFVAAVWAIHPLRVESVAWVSELKDVLSGLFFMLTLWAYARYARRPASWGGYALVILWFVLGLLSKPILVTVPFVLLLLDYWPLARLQEPSHLPRLLREKIPFFALSLLSCVATVLAQQHAIQPIAALPLPLRLGNALIAYLVYLWKTIYPSQLAVLFLSPETHRSPGGSSAPASFWPRLPRLLFWRAANSPISSPVGSGTSACSCPSSGSCR